MLIFILLTETLYPFPECWKLQIFWQMRMFGHFIFEKEMNKSQVAIPELRNSSAYYNRVDSDSNGL